MALFPDRPVHVLPPIAHAGPTFRITLGADRYVVGPHGVIAGPGCPALDRVIAEAFRTGMEAEQRPAPS